MSTDSETDGPDGQPETPDPEDTADDPISSDRLYAGIGLLTAAVAWLLIPIFGVGAIYAGYKLYERGTSTIGGAVLAAAGALPIVFWVAFLVRAI